MHTDRKACSRQETSRIRRGEHLLSLAVGFVLEAPLGCRYLAVDPKDGARGFYELRGFKYWTKSMRRMYLNMRDVARQLEPDESIGLWSDGNDWFLHPSAG